MKKVLKIIGIIIAILIIAIIATPFLFKGTIQDKILYQVNQHVNAKVDIDNVDLSFFRSFPKASVVIDEFSVINYAPFEGDTLAYVKKLALDMSINELFKSASEGISLQKIIIDEAYIAIKTDSLGNANFDITKPSEETVTTEEPENEEQGEALSFALEHYEINNSTIVFIDEQTKMSLLMSDFNHMGDGIIGDKITLDTNTSTEASFVFDGTQYLNKNKLSLDADIELDLENQRYTFKENTFQINRLPLEFTGFVQLADAYTDVDLSFKTPTSDFKNFLAIIPEVYTKDLSGVDTNGDFSINGTVKGKSDDDHIPTMDISILAHDAYFKYPDLPKAVANINIDTKIMNETGILDDTYVKLNNLTFKIDQDTFAAKGSLLNVTKNMIVDMAMNGTLNLGNLNQAYPVELEEDLNGILTANMQTHFDMESLDKEQYQNVKSSGNASMTNFKYTSAELPNEISIEKANVSFTPEVITLDEINMATGRSDLSAKGNIQNIMGFLFSDQDLKGDFDVNSKVFAVDDFMVSGEEDTEEKATDSEEIATKENIPTEDEVMKIPSFLDANLDFNADTVYYDNLELKNAKGTVQIQDETAYLKNVTASIFNGTIGFDGNVSTKPETPTFDVKMGLKEINIAQSFAGLDMIKSLAPVAQALTGTLTTDMNLNGNLDDSLLPILTSLKGNALAEILNAKVSTTNSPMLTSLDSKLDFVDLDRLNLNDIKTNLSFDDGKINVKPFIFKVNDIKITAGGSHSFDQNMDYGLTLDVPAKYLGGEVNSLLAKLDSKSASETTVGIPVGLAGTFTNPKVSLNTGDAIKNLTQQLVAQQKEKIKEEVKTKVKDEVTNQGKKVLTDLLGGSSNESSTSDKTSTTKEDLKSTAKNILGGFLSKKKDSTNN